MSASKYSVVSLFSGAMGLDIGLERTERFRVLACVGNCFRSLTRFAGKFSGGEIDGERRRARRR